MFTFAAVKVYNKSVQVRNKILQRKNTDNR